MKKRTIIFITIVLIWIFGVMIWSNFRMSKCRGNRIILIGESIGNIPGHYGSKAYYGIRLKYKGKTYTTQTLTNILDKKYVLISVCKYYPNIVSLISDYNIDSCAEGIIVPDTGWDEIPRFIEDCNQR